MFGWVLLLGLAAGLGLVLAGLWARQRELREQARVLADRRRAEASGAAKGQLQYPAIDLSRCLGCGTCVRACPEEGVLALVHGQATVVRGAHCVGTAACERECPTGAIRVTVADLGTRRDVPVLGDDLEALGVPGLFLAGEVTAHALVKTAVDHGVLVARAVAQRRGREGQGNGVLDLVIVGAGPAGIAAALEAKRLGLRARVIDQESEVGGTVARYPRAKLVLTQPIDLPLHGRLGRRAYSKEELMDLWRSLVKDHQLDLELGCIFEGLERDPSGAFAVHAGGRVIPARNVCLALGRRGVPKRLGVPGEELPKVAYSLLDADAYAGRRVLVVGGGDSAVEAALGLIARDQNQVTLSYRRAELFRVKPKNQTRLEAAARAGRLRLALATEVETIAAESVQLRDAAGRVEVLANDDVLVMAGGDPPFPLIERCGVSFDPKLRPAPEPLLEQGTGLIRALVAGLGMTLAALCFALWHFDYYGLPTYERPLHPKHDWLRAGRGLGLVFGIASVVWMGANLMYLLRRSGRWIRFGSLTSWMTLHVATGILALLSAILHAGFAPKDTVGGQAFWLLFALFVTGAIGRYVYARVPRATNGRELELAEIRARIARVADDWQRSHPEVSELLGRELTALIERRQWKSSLPARLLALAGAEVSLRRLTRRIEERGRALGLAPSQLAEMVALGDAAHRAALLAAHAEDLRALLATWRWMHRWGAVLVVLLVALHVVYAFAYGALAVGEPRP